MLKREVDGTRETQIKKNILRKNIFDFISEVSFAYDMMS